MGVCISLTALSLSNPGNIPLGVSLKPKYVVKFAKMINPKTPIKGLKKIKRKRNISSGHSSSISLRNINQWELRMKVLDWCFKTTKLRRRSKVYIRATVLDSEKSYEKNVSPELEDRPKKHQQEDNSQRLKVYSWNRWFTRRELKDSVTLAFHCVKLGLRREEATPSMIQSWVRIVFPNSPLKGMQWPPKIRKIEPYNNLDETTQYTQGLLHGP